MFKLEPWVRGPFEILHHANVHYKKGSDFDRRIAMVGFDNAIEVAITTYLQLNPKLRGGAEYQREAVNRWLRNYHSKVEFFRFFIEKHGLAVETTITEIIWYHSIRNEMYHSGNGVVPEKQCLAGLRRAAIDVFKALFGICLEEHLEREEYTVAEHETSYSKSSTTTQLGLFLKSFTTLEKTMHTMALALGIEMADLTQPSSFLTIWGTIILQIGDGFAAFKDIVKQAVKIRDEYIHDAMTGCSDEELASLTKDVDLLTHILQVYSFSSNMLPALKSRYGDWVNPGILGVRIIQKGGTPILEVIYGSSGLDEKVERMNLDFIIVGAPEKGEDELMFSPMYSAQDNANSFFNRLDLYSMLMTGIGDLLFTESGLEDAENHCHASNSKVFRRNG